MNVTNYSFLLELKMYESSVSVPSGSEEHAADPAVALSPLQEVRLGQEVSQLQGRTQALVSAAPCYTLLLSFRNINQEILTNSVTGY